MINKSPLAEEFWEYGKSESCPVYDMHGHMGPQSVIYFPRAQPEQMIASMDSAGVKMLFFSHPAALFAPDRGNKDSIEAVKRFPERFNAYLAINPNYPDIASREIGGFDPEVFVGFKFLSDYHKQKLTSPGYEEAWTYADKRQLFVLAHTWGHHDYNDAKEVKTCAERYPNVRFFLGHSLHDDWDAAVSIAKQHPNVFLELTAVLDDRGIVEMFVGEVGSERLLFGTDLPWFDPHQGIGALLSAEITDEDRHNILHRNAEKLLSERECFRV